MRTKLLSLLMLLTVAINYGQSSANVAGIAIQGIARDNNNVARTSSTISLTFRIYYGSNVAIYEVTKTVTTDAFGVFSAVLEPGETNNIVIANTQAYLKISEGTTIISDEKLKQVPYAIAASNGVPTGSIMPYIGTNAPAGWVMCDGSPLPGDGSEKALQELLGGSAIKNAPDLRGMFLRGAGQNGNGTNAAEIQPNNLKAVQSSDNKSHNHTGNSAGEHTHSIERTSNPGSGEAYDAGDLNSTKNVAATTDRRFTPRRDFNVSNSGEHTHTINSSGVSESRPINYGVNYIIKL
jgi:microcystin-dependent protein